MRAAIGAILIFPVVLVVWAVNTLFLLPLVWYIDMVNVVCERDYENFAGNVRNDWDRVAMRPWRNRYGKA